MKKEMKKRRISIYKVELSKFDTDNLLMFIPDIFVSVSKYSFYLCIRFLCVELIIMLCPDSEKCIFKGISGYVIPHFSFSPLDKDHKEKWDFQFGWLWMGYRKFFGERKIYKDSIKYMEFSRFKLR